LDAQTTQSRARCRNSAEVVIMMTFSVCRGAGATFFRGGEAAPGLSTGPVRGALSRWRSHSRKACCRCLSDIDHFQLLSSGIDECSRGAANVVGQHDPWSVSDGAVARFTSNHTRLAAPTEMSEIAQITAHCERKLAGIDTPSQSDRIFTSLRRSGPVRVSETARITSGKKETSCKCLQCCKESR
jgi:hypothetical protein